MLDPERGSSQSDAPGLFKVVRCVSSCPFQLAYRQRRFGALELTMSSPENRWTYLRTTITPSSTLLTFHYFRAVRTPVVVREITYQATASVWILDACVLVRLLVCVDIRSSFVRPSVYPSIRPSVRPAGCVCICPSGCVSVWMYVC